MNKETIFTVGGTVQASNGLYIPRRADGELLALCRAGRFAYVLTPRQLGKSSLMVRTAEQLTAEGVRSVIIDLSQIGVQVTPEEWYLGLLLMIEEQLWLDTDAVNWWRERAHLGVTQRLTMFFEEVLLKEVNAPVVVFVDEIDTTLSLNFTDDFFAAIRYFYNARALSKDVRRLSFVLIGVATPGDLIRDPQRTPFNIGQRVDLTDFTINEALPLAAGLGLADQEARRVLGWVMKWTNGHPYLTQRLCRALTDQRQIKWSEGEVDHVVASTFFGEKSKQDDNLRFVRDMLIERLPSAVSIGSVMTTYQNVRRGRAVPDEEQSLLKSHLKLSGIVCRVEGSLRLRNAIYREVFNDEWIKLHLPINWTRKLQRAAAGLILTLLLLALPLGGYAWHQRNEAVKQAQKAESALNDAERQRQLAEESRRDADEQRQLAEKLRERAEAKNEEAQQQRELAEAQRRIADAKSLEANQLRTVAEQRRIEAEHLRQVSDARGLELKANIALADKDSLAATVFLATALTLEDNLERRARLLELEKETAPQVERMWMSPNNSAMTIAVFSPNGQQIATGNTDGTVRLYDVDTGNEILQLRGHKGGVTALAYSSQRPGQIVSGGQDTSIRLWDLKKQEAQVLGSHSKAITRLLFAPGGRSLASLSEDGNLLLWDVETRERKTIFESSKDSGLFRDIVFTADGNAIDLLSGDRYFGSDRKYLGPPPSELRWDRFGETTFDEYGNIRIGLGKITDVVKRDNGWAVSRADGTIEWKDKIFRFSDAAVTSISINPSERLLASAGSDGVLHILESKYGQAVLQVSTNTTGLKKVVFSPDGSLLALIDADDRLQLWRLKTEEHVKFFPHRKQGWISALALSSDGRRLASGYSETEILIWNSKGGHLEKVLSGHTGRIRSLAFSSDGKTLTSSSENGEVILWDAENGGLLRWLSKAREPDNSSRFGSVAFTADGPMFAAQTANGYGITIWNANRTEVMRITQRNSVTSYAMSPAGNTLATGAEDGVIRIWGVQTGRELFDLRGHAGKIQSIVFSSNEQRLASLGDDDTIRVWDLSQGKEVWTLREQPGNLTFSVEGEWFALRSHDNFIWLWDMTSGKGAAVLSTPGSTRGLAFSPGGRWLASASGGGPTEVWDVGKIQKFFEKPAQTLMKDAEYRASLHVTNLEVKRISPNTSSPYEEMGLEWAGDGDMKARLDGYAMQLQQQPGTLGYIIVYNSPRYTTEAVLAEAERKKNYLINEHRVPLQQIVVVYGGMRVIRQTELWLVPEGAKLPPLSPTLPPEIAPVEKKRRPTK